MRRWWHDRFGNVGKQEAFGYLVWLTAGAVVAIPEAWSALGEGDAPWPTISGTIGELEYRHPWTALVVVGVIVFVAYYAFRYPTDEPDTCNRTAGGRLTKADHPRAMVPWWLFFPVAVAAVVAGSVVARANDPHDKYQLGRTFYGLIGLFWVVLPTLIAFPRRGREAPFTTLFQTLRNLERRLRPLAVVVGWGLVVLVIHLVLYPWPAIIPDLKDLHDTYQRQRPHQQLQPPPGTPPSPYAP